MIPPKDIAKDLGVAEEQVEEVLSMLKELEPQGLFASGLEECLLMQVRGMDEEELLSDIIRNHLQDIAEGKISTISRGLKISSAEVRKLIHVIKNLNPRPLNGIGGEKAQYILPDVILEFQDGQWNIELNDKWTGNLQVSDFYIHMMEIAQDEELKSYFENKLRRARFIMNAVKQRRTTILGITREILKRQEDYFLGKGQLKPMTLEDIGDVLEIHKSTVSRAIRDKYLRVPSGCVLFRSLFTTGIVSSDGNGDVSRNTVKTKAKGHKWNEGKVTTEPTCTEEGVKTFECTVCGKTKTEKVSALGHDWAEDFTVDKKATCEETGLKSIHCKRCDIKKDETVIPAKGHVAGEKKIENATESTCEKGGSYDEVVYCTVCNKELSRTTVKTEAKGHKWDNGKVTTEPTYAEEGVKTYTCTACGATKTEVIPKRNMEYTVGSTYQDISTNAIYRITVINQQVEYICPIDKKLKKATIPSQIRIGNVTYKVTSIGNNAFKRCKNLSSITIGNNISKIGNKAFYNCKKLKKIKIKSKKLTLKKIGKSAFKKINKKAKISVPKSKKKSYKKMLTKKGLSKTVKIK